LTSEDAKVLFPFHSEEGRPISGESSLPTHINIKGNEDGVVEERDFNDVVRGENEIIVENVGKEEQEVVFFPRLYAERNSVLFGTRRVFEVGNSSEGRYCRRSYSEGDEENVRRSGDWSCDAFGRYFFFFFFFTCFIFISFFLCEVWMVMEVILANGSIMQMRKMAATKGRKLMRKGALKKPI
jgi:hypothetical protein